MPDYTVRAGDTLSGIAARNHVPLAELIGANPGITNRHIIVPGQIVHIPSPASTGGLVLQFPEFRWPRPAPGYPSFSGLSRFGTTRHSFVPGRLLQPSPLLLRPPAPRTFTLPELTGILSRPLPRNLTVNLYGGSGGNPFLDRLLTLPPIAPPATPGITMRGPGTIDVGAQVTTDAADQVNIETYLSLVIHQSAFHRGRIDLFNQPTGTLTVGLGMHPRTGGTPDAYFALALSITMLNAVLIEHGGRPLLELGVGQLSLGAQSGQPMSGQAGIGAELHLGEDYSILASGAISLTPAPGGLTAAPQFIFGFSRHLP